MAASSKKWGTSVQPLKKPTVPTVLAHRQFIDKNKQLTSKPTQTRIYQKKYVDGSEYPKGHNIFFKN
jgi:hypothetical protein